VVLSEGYAPLEQYQKNSPQGPWTDIYGVAATLFRMLKGRPPPPALDRLGSDALEQDLDFSPALNEVLRKGMAVRPEDRFASANDFKRDLYTALDLADTGSAETRRFAPVPEAKSAVWSSPSEAVTRIGDQTLAARHAAAANQTQAASVRKEAWMVVAAIVVGAIIISLPLWFR
jgi:serine/threonine protein kinase